jgi:hypothetical protein
MDDLSDTSGVDETAVAVDNRAAGSLVIDLDETLVRTDIERFGAQAFDDVGNSRANLTVWAVAGSRIAVGAPARVAGELQRLDPAARLLPAQGRRGTARLPQAFPRPSMDEEWSRLRPSRVTPLR